MIIYPIVLWFLFLPAAEQPDYFSYHRAINQAEAYIVQESFDSALVQLERVLQQYDFCFAKDVLLASQVSLLEGRRERSLFWAKRAMKQGYLLSCLRQIPIFRDSFDRSTWDSLEIAFPSLRKDYLGRIDLELLTELSQRYSAEQKAKRTNEYRAVVQGNFNRIKQLMNSRKGFPGEGVAGLDYARLADKLADCDAGNSKVIVTLLHYPHPIAEIGEEPFMTAIADGKLHPREFARIYTFEKQQVSVLYGKTNRIDRSLPTYHFNFPFAQRSDDLNQVNKDRARFGIGKYQVDQQKEAIEIKFGLRLRFSNDI
ncbi:MAG: hypothetical protein F6K19_27930 [Cyanothece sp. SIO1E1]|nr:hypothetical protein [Cyanothece sp. SIO1E1]